MKNLFLVLLLCSCPIVYGQSINQSNSELELDVEESVEGELTSTNEAGIPFLFTMTAGPVESVGRILLSSSDGSTGSHLLGVGLQQLLDPIPETFALYQNYPNPFNPTTTLEFDLPKQSIVTLKMYNTLGQEVATLIHSELMDEGSQEVEFSAAGGYASGLPSGVYFYRLVAEGIGDEEEVPQSGRENFVSVKKMLMIK